VRGHLRGRPRRAESRLRLDRGDLGLAPRHGLDSQS
jgi:hypothetical protein